MLIAGIIGSTVVFVNRLPEAVISIETTTTTVTLVPTSSSTTTTTIDPALAVLTANATQFREAAAALAVSAVDLNAEWDNSDFNFTTAKTKFTDYRDSVNDFKNEVLSASVPEEFDDVWAPIVNSTQAMTDAAGEMLEGLLDAKSATGRRDGLAAVGISQEALDAALVELLSAIGAAG